jgi:hypothetical protein
MSTSKHSNQEERIPFFLPNPINFNIPTQLVGEGELRSRVFRDHSVPIQLLNGNVQGLRIKSASVSADGDPLPVIGYWDLTADQAEPSRLQLVFRAEALNAALGVAGKDDDDQLVAQLRAHVDADSEEERDRAARQFARQVRRSKGERTFGAIASRARVSLVVGVDDPNGGVAESVIFANLGIAKDDCD